MGLPRGHARHARGGGVRSSATRSAGTSCRRPCGARRARTARAWRRRGSRPTAAATWSRVAGSSTSSTAAARPQGWLEVIDAHGDGGRPVTLVHADDPDLRRMCVFDAVVNNADRKGGHVLRGRVQDGGGAVDVRRRPRRHASARTRSCARCCGAGPATPLDDGIGRRPRPPARRRSTATLGIELSELLTRHELARTLQRVDAPPPARAPSRCPATGGRRCPGPRSDRRDAGPLRGLRRSRRA